MPAPSDPEPSAPTPTTGGLRTHPSRPSVCLLHWPLLPCLRGPACPSPPFTRPRDCGMGLVLLPPQNHDSTWNSPSFPDSAAPHVQHPVGGLQVIDPCLPHHHCCSSSGLASGCVSVATSPSLCPHGHLLTSQRPSSTSPTVSTRSLGNTCLIISFQPTLTCFEALKFSRLLFATGFSQSGPSPPGKAMPTFLLPHPHMNTHVPTRAHTHACVDYAYLFLHMCDYLQS